MLRVLVIALAVGATVWPAPADAGRAARAVCVEQCGDAASACVAAAGTKVTRKLERRCLRRSVRQCLRFGTAACPPRCPEPDIVGTWEGGQASCTKFCGSWDDDNGFVGEDRPCSLSPGYSMRFRVEQQGTPSCRDLVIAEPFAASGMLDVTRVPITFEATEHSGVGLIHNQKLRGHIEGDRLSIAILPAPSASIVTPYCATTLFVDSMTRVAD